MFTVQRYGHLHELKNRYRYLDGKFRQICDLPAGAATSLASAGRLQRQQRDNGCHLFLQFLPRALQVRAPDGAGQKQQTPDIAIGRVALLLLQLGL